MATVAERSLTLVCAALVAWSGYAQEPNISDTPETDLVELVTYIGSMRRARDNLLNARDFEAALGPAEIIVSELDTAEEIDVLSSAGDKIVLAYILAELGRFDEAETIYFETIETIGEQEGEMSAALILPLRLLGRSYIGARMFPQAIAVLEQAQDISRRNTGLFNVEQAGLIDDMTTAYLATGDTVTAQSLQVERLEIAQRRFGAEDPQVIPFHNSLADYYERSRLRSSAREQYEAVLGILQSSDGSAGAELEPLRNIARIDLMSGEGHTEALERIESILATEADISPLERGLSLAVLGDARILEDDPEGAQGYYSQAYALLDQHDANALAHFAEPAMVRFVPPLSAVDRGLRSGPYAWGTIVIEFDVGEDGRVEAINRTGIEPADAIERAYVERLRQAYFRPQLVDGVPVATENVLLTHYFRYYVKEEDDDEESDD